MVYVIGQEEIDAVTKVLTDQKLDRYIEPNNNFTCAFEQSFASKIGVKYSIALNSGTSALICGLVGMNISPGDEIIIPAHTYIATIQAVLSVGATPVVCEVDESLTICPEDICSKVTSKTKAIIPVHMHGLPCNMSDITVLAEKYGLDILEDVAQACGGSYEGKRLGSIGTVGCFSFNHHKILSCGEGGAVTTNSMKVYQRAYLYHDGGCVYENVHPNLGNEAFSGINFRISEISSSLLVPQLNRLDNILTSLRSEYKTLCDVIEGTIKPIPLNDINGHCGRFLFITFPSIKEAKDFSRSAKENRIDVIPASTPGHVYADWIPLVGKLDKMDCPKTLDIISRTAGIPTYVRRQEGEFEKVIKWLSEYVN